MENYDSSIKLGVKIEAGNSIKSFVSELKKEINALKKIKDDINSLTEGIRANKELVNDLSKKYLEYVSMGQKTSAEAKETKQAIEEITADIKVQQQGIEELKASAGFMGPTVAKATDNVSAAFKRMGKQITRIAKRVLVFQILYKALAAVKDMLGDILMSDEEFKQDWEELKAAFYTAAHPIVNLIVPALKWIVEKVRDWAISIGQIAAYLQGMTYSELVDQAEASKKTADNYEDVAESAEDVNKSLAGFDKIEIFKTDEGSSDSTGDTYSGFENLKQYDTSGERSMLDELIKAIGGALAAIGLILLFCGAVGWGIGFIIAGAEIWSVSETSVGTYSENEVIDAILKIEAIVSIALVAIGLILFKKGAFAWGLGFIIAGAALYSVSEIWGSEFSESKVTDMTAKIMLSIGAALAAIGLILIVFGQLAWGIPFLIAGAGAFIAGAAAAKWDEMPEKTRNMISIIMGIVGPALLVLGIILCVTGVALGIGVALIAAGAATLVGTVALNWNSIATTVKSVFNSILNWAKTYGLLVVGIILCLTGVALPFGISLIYKWAKDNAGKVDLADAILSKVKSVWQAIKDFWNKNIAQIFTLTWWKNLAIKAGNGLIAGFEGAINGIITAFENMLNWVTDGLNKISIDIPDWVPGIGGDTWGIDIPRTALGRVNIPRLASGAVIPANREFLAVLGDQKSGTNVEAPLSTIEQAVENVLNRRGNDTVKEEHYYLSETELMSILYKLVKRGERIQGTNLIGG